MRFLLAPCLLGCLAAADQPKSTPVVLANDQTYADKVQAVLAERPDGSHRGSLPEHLRELAIDCGVDALRSVAPAPWDQVG